MCISVSISYQSTQYICLFDLQSHLIAFCHLLILNTKLLKLCIKVRWLRCSTLDRSPHSEWHLFWKLKTVAKHWENSHSTYAPGSYWFCILAGGYKFSRLGFLGRAKLSHICPADKRKPYNCDGCIKNDSLWTRPCICICISVFVSSSRSSDYLQCNQSIVCLFIEFGSLFVYLILVCSSTDLDRPESKCRMPDCLHNCVLNACVSLRATKQTAALRKNNSESMEKQSGDWGTRLQQSRCDCHVVFLHQPPNLLHPYRQWARIILSVSRQPTMSKNNNIRHSIDPMPDVWIDDLWNTLAGIDKTHFEVIKTISRNGRLFT